MYTKAKLLSNTCEMFVANLTQRFVSANISKKDFNHDNLTYICVFNMAASKQMMCFVMLDKVCDESIENLMGDRNSDDGVLALLAQNQRKKRVRIEN